ncbi:MAG: hypothetical protein WDO24_23915 [Pseudomonadota bacterium]
MATQREVIRAPVPGLDMQAHFGYPQSSAIRAGGLIFCSGMTALNPDSGEREHGTVTSEGAPHFPESDIAAGGGGLVARQDRADPRADLRSPGV